MLTTAAAAGAAFACLSHSCQRTCAAAEHAAVCSEEGVFINALDVACQQLAEHHGCCTSQLVAQVLAHLWRWYAQLRLVLGLQR